ncbi:TMV resistance protein N, partial [Mucuna pruriens]
MACSTIQSSSSSRTRNFDVFVSFRGIDTRNGFTNFLFAALQRKGVIAFRDDQKIKKGEFLEPELLEAIKGSRVFIVVFSKNYASSTWCMKELTKIVDWVEETSRSVLPIFYDVTPSEVRKQSGKFGKAFAEHEERFKDDLEMVKKWREALKEITNRCGWDLHNKIQHEEIEKIVEEVTNILGHNQILSFGNGLVDMHSRVKQLEKLLDMSAHEVVRVVGICGMGGIGKTTLATALFNKISSQYDACCFIDDVSKILENSGPTGAQKHFLCQVLNQGNMEINNLSQGTMLIRTRLCHLKALIVLDHVDQVDQLEKLALHPKYLGGGSRIIIISRDSHILRNYGVNEVYNVQLLDKNKSLQLLCKKAFKSNDIVKKYEELVYDVLAYVNGLPLAIKVLGSFLFDRDVFEWRSALDRLKENPNKNIMDVLRISFDGLEEMEKEIFLDIACFFSYGTYGLGDLKKFLNYRGFYPDIGIKVLIEKSLISCNDNWEIQMHDLLTELGRSIVREKSPKDPRKWSRLWNYEDLHNVMIKNKEAKNLEAIVINCDPEEFLEKTMRVDALSKMNNLKLLTFENVNFSGSLSYLSNELRYLYWNKYPFVSLPSSFHPDQLVELIIPYSNIKQLWEGTKYLPNLRKLDLSHSKNLIEMPDLRGVPHLRYLDLEGCIEIVQIDPSIGILRMLTYLNLKNCKKLILNQNIIFGFSPLRILNFAGCTKLLNNNKLLKKPSETEHLEQVDKNRSVIQLSTSSVYEILMMPYLSRFPCLLSLDLSFCNLFQIPDAIGNLHSLKVLNLGGNKFVTLPSTIKELPKLEHLNLEHNKQLKYLPELPVPATKEKTTAKYFVGLYIFNCPNLSEIEVCFRMVFSWMIQNLEVTTPYFLSFPYIIFSMATLIVYLQPSLSLNGLVIVIPGTQIPRWFSKQNVGSSISMDVSAIREDPNWTGVAICAILVAHHVPTNLGDRRGLYDYGSIGYILQNKQVLDKEYIRLPIHLMNDQVTGELDHLLIVFHSREPFIRFQSAYVNEMHDLDEWEFTTAIHDLPKGLHLEVKNCGYRWVFKEDLQQLNPNTMFSGNSSSWKQKLLTID